MKLREKAAAARSALGFYLEQIQQLAWAIEDDSPEDEVMECLDLATQPNGKMREAHAEVEEALTRWFVAHGRPKLRTGDLEWWIGKASKVVVASRKDQIAALIETLEEETGVGLAGAEREDWANLLDELLAKDGVKQGSLKKYGDPEKREERWERAYRREFSERLRVKSAPEGAVG